MCGIVGYFGFNLPSIEKLNLASLALSHRGPDSSGTYTFRHSSGKGVAFAHQRLAIIDLDSRSDQPLRVENSVLIFNGEIYNYIEVRKTLQELGHKFFTDGDGEVLARALRQWGHNALDRLEGMWAFAWYDELNGTLLLSRDRFGEKPLYIWRRDEGIYFASEVKGLASLVGVWPSINENHLLRNLINGYKAVCKVRETFFHGVEELTAGTCLLLSPRKSEQQTRYWHPKQKIENGMTYEDAVGKTREALLNSIKLRLRADVPLAFCMSGGIDSNCLIAAASRELGCDVHGFTIVNKDARYEEEELVKLAVNDLEIKHTSILPEKKGFLDNLKTLVEAHDAPVYTVSYYVHWQLMRAIAEQGYKVSISGTGADEIFTGYYDHHNFYLAEIAEDIQLYDKSLSAWERHLAPIVRNPYLKDPEIFVKDPSIRDHIYLNNDQFSTWLHSGWSEEFFENDYDTGLLRNRMMNELFVESVPVILHEDDLNAMYFSIENRSPFLDRSLFETAFSIPVKHLIQNGKAKAVLRDAMQGIVPKEILNNRKKVGFNAPILDLVDLQDVEVRDYILSNGPIYDLVCRNRIEKLLEQRNLPNSMSKFLFSFINTKMFLEM